MNGGVSRISVSVDPGLLSEFDTMINGMGYNRSSAVEVSMRDFITEYKWQTEGVDLAGAITMIFDHHTGGISESLNHLQHDYIDIISSTIHVHLDHNNCLEILAIKGKVEKIKKLYRSLAVTRGIQQIKLSLVQLPR